MPVGSIDTASGSEAMQALMSFACKPEQHVHVNTVDCLKLAKLDDFAPNLLPSGQVVDELAGSIAKMKKRGVCNPFERVELEKFLPP